MTDLEVAVQYLENHPWLAKCLIVAAIVTAISYSTSCGVITIEDARNLIGSVLGIIGLALSYSLFKGGGTI